MKSELLLIGNTFDLVRNLVELATLPVSFTKSLLRRQSALAAENLFLRRQIGLLMEHGSRPRRPTNGRRLAMVWLSRLFDWKDAITIVQPATFLRWHRQGFKLIWRWKSRPVGRPPIPEELRELIVRMAEENPTWGQERIASELLLKLGIRLSPRTVAKYLPSRPRGSGRRPRSQSWKTFLRNHGKTIVACDFLTAVTLRFQLLHVFVVMDVGRRKILHTNVTPHPTAAWTIQQFREALPWEHGYDWLIHDRAGTFSPTVDRAIQGMGMEVIRTPRRAPLANAHCERLNGTIRREFLDHIIPLSEEHLRRLLKEWVEHYNRGRPHSSLGPGLPSPCRACPVEPLAERHQLPSGANIVGRPILGGLHHEYHPEHAPAPT